MLPLEVMIPSGTPGVGVPLAILFTLVAIAFAAGWVDAVVGGGGLIQLPSLMIMLPDSTPPPYILSTNKLSSAAGTLIATVTYLRRVRLKWATVLPLIGCAFAGSALGSSLARYLPKAWMTPIVLVAIIAVGIYTVRKPNLGLEHRELHSGAAHIVRVCLIGLVIGFYDGALGPGTGSFFVIAIVALLGYGFLQATAYAKVANLTTNVASILVFGFHGEVLWLLGGCMAAANLTGGLIGARMALRFGNRFIRRVFLVVITILAVRLSYDTYHQFFG